MGGQSPTQATDWQRIYSSLDIAPSFCYQPTQFAVVTAAEASGYSPAL
jgi:hypothetical protein